MYYDAQNELYEDFMKALLGAKGQRGERRGGHSWDFGLHDKNVGRMMVYDDQHAGDRQSTRTPTYRVTQKKVNKRHENALSAPSIAKQHSQTLGKNQNAHLPSFDRDPVTVGAGRIITPCNIRDDH